MCHCNRTRPASRASFFPLVCVVLHSHSSCLTRQILDQTGKERMERVGEVKPRKMRHGQALDSGQNVIARDSFVRVVDGPNKVFPS